MRNAKFKKVSTPCSNSGFRHDLLHNVIAKYTTIKTEIKKKIVNIHIIYNQQMSSLITIVMTRT